MKAIESRWNQLRPSRQLATLALLVLGLITLLLSQCAEPAAVAVRKEARP